jgi:hypothetical protein
MLLPVLPATAVAGSTGVQNAHGMILQLEDDLFEMGSKVEELHGKVMDSIHSLEADQPMISLLFGIYDNLGQHFRQFGQGNPELAHGTIPPDRRKRRPSATPISLSELFARDRETFWKPAMPASAILDPLNWTKNALGQFHMPLGKLTEEQRVQVDATLSGFQLAVTDDAENELMELEVYSFEQRYTKLLSKLTDKVVVEQGKNKVVHVTPHGQRISFFNNKLGDKYPVCTHAVNTLLSMPVTACSAERNWSKWGATYVPNKNAL